MAKTTADLWFRFFSDTKSLDKGSKRARSDLSKTEKAADKAARGFSGMQRALGAVGLAMGAREILDWSMAASEMADSARVAAQSADKVLGPAANDLRDDFEDLRKTMGFNSGEFDQLIAKQGLLVTGMGVGSEAAGEYIGDLVTLGGDLATFAGDVGRTEEAIDAVTAAIRGEFDPLEQWGVKLSESKIKAEIARREGTDPLFASLSEGEKRMVVITDLIRTSAAPAIGSLGEAADTAAGKTNELTAAQEDLQIELGTYLTPILNDMTENTIDLFDALARLADETNGWRIKAGALGDAWDATAGQFLTATEDVREEIEIWSRALRTAKRWVDNLISSIRRIPSSVKNPFSGWRMPKLNIPGFATGGIVPGPVGTPQLAVVHGGEEVRTPAQQRSGGGGGGGITINVSAPLGDPQAIASHIVDLLRIYNRTQGALPVTIEGGIG